MEEGEDGGGGGGGEGEEEGEEGKRGTGSRRRERTGRGEEEGEEGRGGSEREAGSKRSARPPASVPSALSKAPTAARPLGVERRAGACTMLQYQNVLAKKISKGTMKF